MRYLLLLTMLSVMAVPAIAGKNTRDETSPEMKQCIESCKKVKETTAHEGCLVECSKTDAARPQQKQKPSSSDKK